LASLKPLAWKVESSTYRGGSGWQAGVGSIVACSRRIWSYVVAGVERGGGRRADVVEDVDAGPAWPRRRRRGGRWRLDREAISAVKDAAGAVAVVVGVVG